MLMRIAATKETVGIAAAAETVGVANDMSRTLGTVRKHNNDPLKASNLSFSLLLHVFHFIAETASRSETLHSHYLVYLVVKRFHIFFILLF